MAEVDCVKFKINIKCAWQEEKTVYRVKFTRKNFEIRGKSHKSINLHFAVHNQYFPWTVFQNRSMMPPSYGSKYYSYISYSIQAKIEDETIFGNAKYCDRIPLNLKLCKDIWAASTVDGF
jgi:hypothetical protein